MHSVTPPTAKSWLSVVRCVRQQSVYFVKYFITNNTKTQSKEQTIQYPNTLKIHGYLKSYCSPSFAHTRSRRTSEPLGWPLNTLQVSPLPPLSSADLQDPPSQDAGLHRSLLRRVKSLLDPRHTLTRYQCSYTKDCHVQWLHSSHRPYGCPNNSLVAAREFSTRVNHESPKCH